jgi:hypothetical protein
MWVTRCPWCRDAILSHMAKRRVDIDERALAAAKAAPGTKTLKTQSMKRSGALHRRGVVA